MVIPLLGWLSFIQAGKLVERMASVLGWFKGVRMDLGQAPAEELNAVYTIIPMSLGVLDGILSAVFVARFIRRLYRNRHGVARINYPEGKVMSGAVGPTILEFIQTAGIPHASVCGGLGRCPTCRVQIARRLAEVDKPSEHEAKALGRISAPNGVRLACQVRPRRDITIVPLLLSTATARDGRLPGGL